MSARDWILAILCALLAIALAACTGVEPTHTPTTHPEPTATQATGVKPTEAQVTCSDVDAHWGKDWPTVLSALKKLIAADQTCGAEPLSSKLYAAHFSYAVALENSGDLDDAITQYQAALALDPHRNAALDALVRLDALPEPTPPPCLSTAIPRPDPAPEEPPDPSTFVSLLNGRLVLNGKVFQVRGVNYYPRRAPWHRFLQEPDLAEMTAELDLIEQAGLNTLRVFLWYDPLFTCQPEDAIPNEDTFAQVDALIQLARERDLKLIVTLNDLPDLTFRPLYTDWARYDAQTTYIVRRYRNEASILAWDLRNEGDLDYGAQPGDQARFGQEQVIEWLAHTSQLVRENDPYHLLTAGWWGDPIVTGPYVDLLSFHHWYDAQQLRSRIEQYRQQSDQPLLLQEVGYHSWAEAPQDVRNEATQAEILASVIREANEQGHPGLGRVDRL